MGNFRFERTDYGYRALVRRGDCFVYFGHFYTKKAARASWAETLQRHDLEVTP